MKKYSFKTVGCDFAKEYLISALEGGFLSHAYIIEGSEGSGRHTLVNDLLTSLACESENAPCGECANCVRIGAGVCVDIYKLHSNEGKSEFTVDLIRGIYDSIALSPNDLDFKAYIIEDGEKMNQSAQNAFLKLLEEPPGEVYFFILTTDSSKLLPTVRSRALTLKTEKLNNEQLNAVLDGLGVPDDKKRRNAVKLCGGCAGAALKLYNGEDDIVRYRAVAEKLKDIYLSDGSSKLAFVDCHQKNIKNLSELCTVYRSLQNAFHDIALCRCDALYEPLFFESIEKAEECCSRISDKAALKAADIITELLSASDIPLNAAAAMTEFASRLWDARVL